ncbi:DUF222 domain-containing protein [uncultured Friedmanniella sp.]|uniref:HNH endonuclease signature motif containing protein n=1 Tax=uncultured Friedmanniella sp. TaxID=335381 RepID=UPI0035C94CFC
MARGNQQDSDAVGRALTLVEGAFGELLDAVDDGGLAGLDPLALVAFLQRWERLRNRLPMVDHAALTQAEADGLADQLTQPNLTRVLVGALRLSAGESRRRVRAAEAVGPRTALTGERLEPVRPLLAEAQRAGEVTPEQVQVVVRALAGVDGRGFDPDDVAAGERLLTEHASTFEPKVLGLLAEQVVAAIDPDGTLPDDRLVAERRSFNLRPTPDGGFRGEFRLTGVAGVKLAAVLRPLARPKIDRILCAEGAEPVAAEVTGTDDRTHGQRMHDALEEVCDRVLRSGTLPDSGGVPATVIVTIDEDSLMRRSGVGHTTDGVALSTAQILELAEEADVIPTVLTGAGAVVAYGRSRRIASPAQTLALIARDGGCSFPGCDRAPELCERHHVVAWVDGGFTDLDNLTLLCRYHHHQFEQRGWSAAINRDGLPEWRPPRWIDREQRPLLHDRIRQRQLGRAIAPTLVSTGGP